MLPQHRALDLFKRHIDNIRKTYKMKIYVFLRTLWTISDIFVSYSYYNIYKTQFSYLFTN